MNRIKFNGFGKFHLSALAQAFQLGSPPGASRKCSAKPVWTQLSQRQRSMIERRRVQGAALLSVRSTAALLLEANMALNDSKLADTSAVEGAEECQHEGQGAMANSGRMTGRFGG